MGDGRQKFCQFRVYGRNRGPYHLFSLNQYFPKTLAPEWVIDFVREPLYYDGDLRVGHCKILELASIDRRALTPDETTLYSLTYIHVRPGDWLRHQSPQLHVNGESRPMFRSDLVSSVSLYAESGEHLCQICQERSASRVCLEMLIQYVLEVNRSQICNGSCAVPGTSRSLTRAVDGSCTNKVWKREVRQSNFANAFGLPQMSNGDL